jgi:PQQ-dependent catabolism-associated CXXCW motif protein
MHRATLQSQRDIVRKIIARRFPRHWPTLSRLRRPKLSGAPGAATFIDVLPHPPKPQDLPAGTIWREKPRLNIPGSVWLPDTGYGTLAAATEDYLRHGLARLSQCSLVSRSN